MTKKIACVQSCYIPWKGYFDIIRQADLFILYDCVQYTKRDWRNRNRIKTQQGLHWLTIPVKYESRNQLISDVVCVDDQWKKSHWKSIMHNYSKSPFFEQYEKDVRELYSTCSSQRLSEINLYFLQGICKLMKITTPLSLIRNPFPCDGDKTDRLIAVCKNYEATHYISGSKAQNYLEIDKFCKVNIGIQWMDYSHYPEYKQLYSSFEHSVSVLDLLFNTGDAWKNYIGAVVD